MKTVHLAFIAVLVGAIGLAPTELRSAEAATTAQTNPAAMSVSTKAYGAVAGSSSAATATSAYVLPTFTAGCTGTTTSSANTAIGATTITIGNNAATGIVVGMIVSGPAGIPAGTKILTFKATNPKNITISNAVTIAFNTGTALNAAGCWQQYFSVNNIRNTALNSFGIQQVFTSISPETITVQRCSLIWTEATGACSGTITTIVTGSVTSAVTTAAIALAASTGTARLRALATTSGVTATISVLIRRATDVAAGTTSNS